MFTKTINVSDIERFTQQATDLAGTCAAFSESIKQNLADLRSTNVEVGKKIQEIDNVIKELAIQKNYLNELLNNNIDLIKKVENAITEGDE